MSPCVALAGAVARLTTSSEVQDKPIRCGHGLDELPISVITTSEPSRRCTRPPLY